MNNEKISLIATVLNEEENIKDFLESIINQTRKPDEFIIVDGGSKDNTYKILKKFAKKYNWIKIFQKKGTNISQGRNFAISKTKNDIIVVCDAGTKFEKDWLMNLLKGFNGEVGFGKTLPLIQSKFQKILAKKMHQRFGSSRNIIFAKKIWKDIGGYPEDLDIAEDTVFNERIKKKGYKIGKIENAIGYWGMRENLEEVRNQFYNYGLWDGIAYHKYKILPIKSKIAVMGLLILYPLYPLFAILSRFSLSFKIEFIKRISYLKGFLKSFVLQKNK